MNLRRVAKNIRHYQLATSHHGLLRFVILSLYTRPLFLRSPELIAPGASQSSLYDRTGDRSSQSSAGVLPHYWRGDEPFAKAADV